MRFSKLKTVFIPLLIALVFISLVEILNLRAAPANGALLSALPSPIFTCNAHKGDVILANFTVRNISSDSIKLLGATTSCGCTTVNAEFPMDLAPNSEKVIPVRVNVGNADEHGKYTKSVQLLVDRRGVVPLLIVDATVSPITVP